MFMETKDKSGLFISLMGGGEGGGEVKRSLGLSVLFNICIMNYDENILKKELWGSS